MRPARPSRPWALLSVILTLSAALPVLGDTRTADVKAHIGRIEEGLEAWDVAGARAALNDLEAMAPKDAEPLQYFQGRLAFEEGRYEEAARLLEKAGIADKAGSYLRLAKETQEVTKGHERQESEHFIFSYPPGKDALLAPYALETLESIRQALLEDLGYAPPGKVRVEVVHNARELASVSTLTYKQIQTTGTIAICKFNKLMVTSPKAVVHGYDWADTLAHEYVHLVVSQMSRNRVPIWLHEGLAKYLESRWRGEGGLALTPYSRALLGSRVKKNTLIPFEKMHPSIALLPSAEDAATAFAEVFFAVDHLHRTYGKEALRKVIENLRDGKDDRRAVEAATGVSFAAFEKSWMAHLRKQPYPQELAGRVDKKVVLKEDQPSADPDDEKKGKEIAYGAFAEVEELDARRFAHLGELMRERGRPGAAAVELGKAHRIVGDKYEFISNKLALALLELGRLEEARSILESSLRVHPSEAATLVHLGRIHMHRGDFEAARKAYREALFTDPFDPEIHFALAQIESRRGDATLAQRAKGAAAVLAGIRPEQVDEVAQRLFRGNDLSQAHTPTPVPQTPPESGAAGGREPPPGAAEPKGGAAPPSPDGGAQPLRKTKDA